MSAQQNIYQNSLQLSLKNKQEEVETRKIIIKEQEKKIRQEIKKAEIQLKKIKNSKNKRSVTDEYILLINNTLIKIKAQLIDLQNKIKEFNTIKQLKNSEKSTNKIKFKKLKAELVNLKIKIEELSLFNGSIKQLQILQKKQNSLLDLKQEWLKKDEIKAELERLERYKEQLIAEININDKKIADILNENENIKNKLIDEIRESLVIIKSLMKNIKTKDNLVSDLKTNIISVNKNIEEKRIKIQRTLDAIVNLQNWRDSSWRRVIVVLTINLFCSKKRVINKRGSITMLSIIFINCL
ncbi:hypothetical protein [Spiroplasma endosymbiont of Polydrusus pterygomalis]|uniref:hypothetical protein n=1 Tax=Spiroplasma endosymbiont of Polydrusus pterygomalis TaxID=3139327 RepID=UPI003CCB68BE